MYRLYLWYATTFYRLPAYPYGTLLSSTGSLPLPLIIYYILLVHCLSLWDSTAISGSAPCIYLCYSSTFYWPTSYTYGTLLPSTDPLPIPMVLYYLLLATTYTNGTRLSSIGSRPIHMLFYYLLLDPCLYL